MYNYLIGYSSVIITSVLGSLFTSKNTKSEWYNCIKPSITPPNIVFPIVWTTLYFLIGTAFALSLKNKKDILNILFVITLIFNVLWSYVYFGKKQIKLAFIIILLMDIIGIIILIISFNNRQNMICYLMIPYVLWILFASVLNYLSIEKAKKCTK